MSVSLFIIFVSVDVYVVVVVVFVDVWSSVRAYVCVGRVRARQLMNVSTINSV